MTKKIDGSDIVALVMLAALLWFAPGCGMLQPRTPQEITTEAERINIDTAFDVIEKEVATAIDAKNATQAPTNTARASAEAGKAVSTNIQTPENNRAENGLKTQITTVAKSENQTGGESITKSGDPDEDSESQTCSTEDENDIGDIVLENRDWLFFLAYCAISLLAAWYLKRTGTNSETLQKITETVGARLSFKHRALFRVLRFIYRRKKIKKDQQRKDGEK